MKYRLTRSLHVALALAGLGLGLQAHAQAAPVAGTSQINPAATAGTIDPMWKESFDAFAAEDKATPPHLGGVLFVGSSSIRLWDDLVSQFTDSDPYILKRGFGGSRLSDLARYVPQLVLPYKPRLVVVYSGDNDVAEGQTPEQILASFKSIVTQVHAGLPETRIAYISIKPSPSRESLMPVTLQANELIERYIATDPSLDYIDIYPKMLGPDGKPRRDLYRADMLHLNPSGYAIWKTAITSHLRRSEAATLTQALTAPVDRGATPAGVPKPTVQPAGVH